MLQVRCLWRFCRADHLHHVGELAGVAADSYALSRRWIARTSTDSSRFGQTVLGTLKTGHHRPMGLDLPMQVSISNGCADNSHTSSVSFRQCLHLPRFVPSSSTFGLLYMTLNIDFTGHHRQFLIAYPFRRRPRLSLATRPSC